MTWLWGSPPRIKHIYARKEDDRDALCIQCGASLHLSSSELTLLRYYAKQKSGFSPAVATVTTETGLSRRTVFRVRSQLMDRGVIGVDSGRLLIDWQRIRTFASLDPSLTNKNITASPVMLPRERACGPEPDELCFIFAPLESVCAYFASMTEHECQLWRTAYRKRSSRKMAL